MAKDFNEFLSKEQASWDDADWRVYNAASAMFVAEMNAQKELGSAIADARKARELSQAALAKLADVQQAEISRIERGLGNPTATTLMRLAEALGTRIALIPAQR